MQLHFINILFVGRSLFQFSKSIMNVGNDAHEKSESQHCCHSQWIIINFFHNVLWSVQKITFCFNRKTLRNSKTGNTCLRFSLDKYWHSPLLFKSSLNKMKYLLSVEICLHGNTKYTTRITSGHTPSHGSEITYKTLHTYKRISKNFREILRNSCRYQPAIWTGIFF